MQNRVESELTNPAGEPGNVESIIEHLRGKEPEELIRFSFVNYGKKAAIGTSLQKTGVVIIDLASKLGVDFRVYFVDTRENFPETYELVEEVEKKYGITIERIYPDKKDIEQLEKQYGSYAHYFARSQCCRIKKDEPNKKMLNTLDVWIAGLRKDQSLHRACHGEKVSIHRLNNRDILKINPLFDWTQEKIDDYIKQNHVPYNKLYDIISDKGEKYTVIGCKSCHVPVLPHLSRRAGKFPWEDGYKECGLHIEGSGI